MKTNGEPISASVHVIDDHYLEFPGYKNIGNYFFNHDQFSYKLSGDKMILVNDDFETEIPYEMINDSVLKLDIEHEGLSSYYFTKMNLHLKGKHVLAGYGKKQDISHEEIKQYCASMLSGVLFNFNDDNTVEVSSGVLSYLKKDEAIKNHSFTYEVQGDRIAFINNETSFQLPFIYDGILHFIINDDNFSRWDMHKIDN